MPKQVNVKLQAFGFRQPRLHPGFYSSQVWCFCKNDKRCRLIHRRSSQDSNSNSFFECFIFLWELFDKKGCQKS